MPSMAEASKTVPQDWKNTRIKKEQTITMLEPITKILRR